ncbi:hypothetical protein AVO45_16880 [Ruegeria marisrubri]|uniref:Uncharacterized protein n=1 Tax=Ruegeria marisrubri TaxID=1685379 RepID=A0A0X3UD78_9RHOB|nr:hypothetical protein [Ruegeria marisrubri]KUJ85181.1 hypothetical protein AVO45_16880 [Ruegeria marisrubri]
MLHYVGILIGKLKRDERGATLVEYAIALLVAIGVGGFVVTNLSTNTQDNFCSADDAVQGAAPDGC